MSTLSPLLNNVFNSILKFLTFGPFFLTFLLLHFKTFGPFFLTFLLLHFLNFLGLAFFKLSIANFFFNSGPCNLSVRA